MFVNISNHTQHRIADRLGALVTASEIVSAVRKYSSSIPCNGIETWVLVKDLGERVILSQTSSNGSKVNGQLVWAVCFRNSSGSVKVATVLLAGAKKERKAHKIYLEG